MEPKKALSFQRILIVAAIFLACFAMAIIGFVIYKGSKVSQGIRIDNASSSSFLSELGGVAGSFVSHNRSPLKGEANGRINILLLGRAGEHYPGQNLTDTIMIMSIDPEHRRVALLSLPRDLYVPIPGTNLYTKLNSLYQYGANSHDATGPVREAIENITGLTLHYFVMLDFDGFEKAVEALGGIRVDVIRDFHDERYPGKNYSYETFDIKKGWQTLDGATALKYVRERHNDPEGDFGRAKRQQQVIQAMKDKAFSIGTFLNIFTINDLLTALGESVKTDMSLDDIRSFLELIQTLDTQNVTTQVIDAWKPDSLLRVSHIQVGPVAAFILVPRVGNWSEVRDIADNLFRLDMLKERQNHILEEQASIAIIYDPSHTTAARKLSQLISNGGMGFSAPKLIMQKTLASHAGQGIIVDMSGLTKPFSLDELIKRFTLNRDDQLPNGLFSPGTDLAIIVGDDMTETLDFDDITDASTALQDNDAFPEALAPQPKR